MVEFQQVADLIKSNMADADVRITDLTGTMDHLGITVISDEFDGKALLDQHQMIMDILREKLKEEIHAVQIKTMTFEKARKKGLVE
ncbi:MAG: BolA family transcriptional regulator [Deltaproteobacteria bacterium]|jgi:stress-induced morphogen|nr:MAG: BolA family transcriptional regulator [Deltaproteobacteria bacterium]TNF26374.1 MAG: BolA family transcriptional regulator [Deltaproteobacteria bacterium]